MTPSTAFPAAAIQDSSYVTRSWCLDRGHPPRLGGRAEPGPRTTRRVIPDTHLPSTTSAWRSDSMITLPITRPSFIKRCASTTRSSGSTEPTSGWKRPTLCSVRAVS